MSRKDVRRRIDEELAALRNAVRHADRTGSRKDSWRAFRNNPAVRQAFAIAGLDRDNPAHLAALLTAFASARFGKGSPGRPKKWDSFSWSQLLLNFLRVRFKNPTLKDEAICDLLRDKRLYQKYSARRLVRILQDAADHKQNLLLRHTLAMMPEELLRIADRHRRHVSIPKWQDLPDHWDELKK